MAIIRITREQLREARKAHKAALKKDKEYRAFIEEQEEAEKEAAKQAEREEAS